MTTLKIKPVKAWSLVEKGKIVSISFADRRLLQSNYMPRYKLVRVLITPIESKSVKKSLRRK
jgi:hypothetical protein